MLDFFKNKHMILAMFIAPVLAIVAYFATDHVVSAPPEPVKAGQSYPMAAKSNCRYESGLCTLKNGDIEIHFRAEKIEHNILTLSAQSSVELQNIMVALAPEAKDIAPSAMRKNDQAENAWLIQLQLPSPASSPLTTDYSNTASTENSNNSPHEELTIANLKELKFRIAIQAEGATFFAETGTDFFVYDTIFSRENFSKI